MGPLLQHDHTGLERASAVAGEYPLKNGIILENQLEMEVSRRFLSGYMLDYRRVFH